MAASLAYLRRGIYSLAISLLIYPALSAAQGPSDYDRAVATFAAKDYRSAAAQFTAIGVASPGSTDALLYKAKCLVQIQEFADAEKALRIYIGLHPESADALYLLGFVVNRENKPAESLEIYTRAAVIHA